MAIQFIPAEALSVTATVADAVMISDDRNRISFGQDCVFQVGADQASIDCPASE